jgi:hypothetical protein
MYIISHRIITITLHVSAEISHLQVYNGFTVGVRPREVADAWYTPLIETTKMNTELNNNNCGVKGKT